MKKALNTNKIAPRLILFLLFITAITDGTSAYSLKQFSSKNGLSNSAVLSLCQDSKGLIWIGTCDGLNTYDGKSIRLYNPVNVDNNLSGNLIDCMTGIGNDIFWIQTNYGLDRLNTQTQDVCSYKKPKGIKKMAQSGNKDLYLISDEGYLYYIKYKGEKFIKLNAPQISIENVCQLTIDSSNRLWIFSSHGQSKCYVIKKNKQQISLIPEKDFKDTLDLAGAFCQNDLVYLVDKKYSFYDYNLNNRRKTFIANIAEEVRQRGEISSVIKQHQDYFIGFKNSGLIQLKRTSTTTSTYVTVPINIQSGIFCLMKDRFQDIIWVGTDGQGVYMYYNDTFSIRNTLLSTPIYQTNTPVRAILLDEEQSLWIGTKGNGILRMSHYDSMTGTSSKTDKFLKSNSTLNDNSVYCFASSCRKRLWIGTESGICYYSYPDRFIKPLPVNANGKEVRYVHSILELNDSTLWVSTVGEGIVKINFVTDGHSVHVKSAKRIVTDGGRQASNYFFTSCQENDSIVWFGNRGYGAYRMNVKTGCMEAYRFDKTVRSQTVNDIFSILKSGQNYWFGTSFGLVRLHQGRTRVYNETDGFPNNTIHGILEGKDQNLWLSTNQGLVKFNVVTGTTQVYRQQDNQEVSEFSDGAFYKDKITGTLFFGGTNGFVAIHEGGTQLREYMPELFFNHLSIFGKECNIYNLLQNIDHQKTLVLKYNQNFFSLSFAAIDCINGNNYTYFYKLDGLSDNWVENGTSTTAVFSNLFPGRYTLLVKYRNNITGKESKPYTLFIQVTPPWYMTTLAYWLYTLLALILAGAIAYFAIRRYKRKKRTLIEEMKRHQREELYESKLRFFTNVTHEFCTPLTLISGPCEKILSYPKTDSYIGKFASMIQQNAVKLNALILELIEFRRLETGHKSLEIQELCITQQTRSIAESFYELAERQELDYQLRIEEHMLWNSDASCFSKIVNNLLSNAFKYTPKQGSITIEQCIDRNTDELYIRVSNSGKGIKQEDLTKIFDRYKILDNFEIQNHNGAFPRNGLGLAICHSMVNLLNGHIKVTSIPDEITTFEVVLPRLVTTISETKPFLQGGYTSLPDLNLHKFRNANTPFNAAKRTIMIIDDDPSVSWFITEIFIQKYNVQSFDSAEKAMEQLQQEEPHLIISDVMMPGMDGISFTKKIKSNKVLKHIPLILLSALNNMNEQTKGIHSGAEAYVTKPFNVDYLEKLVARLIEREKELKEYYRSPLSSFELNNGRFLHKEDKSFFDKIILFIDENIKDPELSAEIISSSVGYSTRQFYRLLKNITDKSPTDLIKEYRLTKAEQLLLTSHLTVEEIIDATGFVNRGTFYKLFSQKYEMTPKQYRESKNSVLNNHITTPQSERGDK